MLLGLLQGFCRGCRTLPARVGTRTGSFRGFLGKSAGGRLAWGKIWRFLGFCGSHGAFSSVFGSGGERGGQAAPKRNGWWQPDFWGASRGVRPAGRGRFSSPSALPWGDPICSAVSSAGLPSSRKIRSCWRESSGGLRG